jgi:hypothetical protein
MTEGVIPRRYDPRDLGRYTYMDVGDRAMQEHAYRT